MQVGCSSYLTPSPSQGFGPHYDDAEIFVVQLAGVKRWRLYKRPHSKEEPRTTAVTQIKQKDLGTPIHECELKPGDVMYFPRGLVHQAVTESGEAEAEGGDNAHSLHLTFSTYQRMTWYDIVERALPTQHLKDKLAGLQWHTCWLHHDVPITLLDGTTAGNPTSRHAWNDEQVTPRAFLPRPRHAALRHIGKGRTFVGRFVCGAFPAEPL